MSRNHNGRGIDGSPVGWSSTDSKRARAIIAATLPAPCVQPVCQMGGIVYPGQLWDASHIGDALQQGDKSLSAIGPGHRKCNRSDGGKIGAAMTAAAKRDSERRLKW